MMTRVVSTSSPTQAPPVAPGAILAGKYRVERIIGQGGMTLVAEAHDIALDERVALKLLLPDYAQNAEVSARFLREGKEAARLTSEHVARVRDAISLESGVPCLVMEFLDGRDLGRTLDLVGVLPVADAIDYILQACEAIAEAHSLGIVHRDLKPANLFLGKRRDGTQVVKVLDFGISKSGGGILNLSKAMAGLGSALYMSPEQMQQAQSVDHRTDIYALGITLYELLAGKQPYYAETLPQLCAEILTGTPTPLRAMRPEIPEELAQVVEKSFARDREERYPSIAELVIALAPFAPLRSQAAIERVAHIAALPVPTAGGAAERIGPPPPGEAALGAPALGAPALGAAEALPSLEALPPPRGSAPELGMDPLPKAAPLPALDEPAAAAQAPPTSRAGGELNQIVLGPYSAPMSARAAASFAQGPPVDAALLTRVKRRGHDRPPGALVFSIVAIVAIGGVAAAFALRSGGRRPDERPTPTLQPLPPPPPLSDSPTDSPTAAPATPSVTADELAPPAPPMPAGSAPAASSASAAPSAAPSATPSGQRPRSLDPPTGTR